MTDVIRGTNAVLLDGPCPFLTCLETGPHGHDVCPDCRAVKFGNMFCVTCRSHWPGGDPLASTMTGDETP
jgi:hypothetical protein